MLTCEEASYLASKKIDGKLRWNERIGFWLHIAMCRLCRRYAKDIKKLHALMLKKGKTGQVLLPESVTLSEKSRERIKKVLNKALQQAE